MIGVGGYDTLGTTATSDDVLGTYSAGIGDSDDAGTGFRGGRLAPAGAAGTELVPRRRLTPKVVIDSRYFRGSGTSQAAAITSGTIALILQKYPTLTPDQVKRFIAANTLAKSWAPIPTTGEAAGSTSPCWRPRRPPATPRPSPTAPARGPSSWPVAPTTSADDGVVLTRREGHLRPALQHDGLGDGDGGRQHLVRRHLERQHLVRLDLVRQSTWSGSTWSGSTWSGSTWSGSTWSGSTWSGSTWSGSTWSGSTWSGSSWSGNTWSGNTWSSGSWN